MNQHQPQFDDESGILRYLAQVPVLNIVLMVSCIALLAGYLVMNTRSATSGFQVRALEQDIVALEEQQSNLNLDIVSKQSMDNVQKIIQEKGFVPVQNVDIIEKKDGPVAAK